jgi:gamma-glutamyltranspeptidase/glutathione hydrolase
VILALFTWLVESAPAQTELPKAKPTKPVGNSVKQWSASGTKGAVAAGGPEAVDVGIAVLKKGGNAADAAAATILALTVTDANQFCFGGEVPILICNPRRKLVEVIGGMGTAPRLATVEYFAPLGKTIPTSGIKPAAVPATLDAVLTLLDRHGNWTFAEIAAPTLAILDRHEHDWHANLAKTLRRLIDAEKASPTDRSRGLRLAADYFYRGPIARELDAFARKHDGLLRFADLATHVTRIEDPVTVNYRGWTICKCGPWTQGPYLLQSLQILEGYDLKKWGHNSADSIHHAVEALKLGLADRDTHYGDPLFADVPLVQLLSPKYAELRRGLIDPKQASLQQRPGDPRHGKPLLGAASGGEGPAEVPNDTTTCVVAGGDGSWVAATPSGWSGVLAPDLGIWLGSRLQSFNLTPSHPNCIEPGKRPRITLTPTLVLKAGQPVIAVSVAGGDGQDQVTLQILLNLIDFGQSPAEAVSGPRFWTQHFISSFGRKGPELGSLRINPEAGDEAIAELKRRGHLVEIQKGHVWAPTLIQFDVKAKLFKAAGDPKASRHAAAY